VAWRAVLSVVVKSVLMVSLRVFRVWVIIA